MILQIALGVFIFVLGLNGINSYNSTFNEAARAVGKLLGSGSNSGLNLVVSIIELVAGIILVGGVFLPIDSKALFFAGFLIFVLWGIRMAMAFFMEGFMEPSFLPWLSGLSLDMVVLVSLWLVSTSYR